MIAPTPRGRMSEKRRQHIFSENCTGHHVAPCVNCGRPIHRHNDQWIIEHKRALGLLGSDTKLELRAVSRRRQPYRTYVQKMHKSLQLASLDFQRFSLTIGNSTRHKRDMGRAKIFGGRKQVHREVTNAEFAYMVAQISRTAAAQSAILAEGMWNPNFCAAEANPHPFLDKIERVLKHYRNGGYRHIPNNR